MSIVATVYKPTSKRSCRGVSIVDQKSSPVSFQQVRTAEPLSPLTKDESEAPVPTSRPHSCSDHVAPCVEIKEKNDDSRKILFKFRGFQSRVSPGFQSQPLFPHFLWRSFSLKNNAGYGRDVEYVGLGAAEMGTSRHWADFLSTTSVRLMKAAGVSVRLCHADASPFNRV